MDTKTQQIIITILGIMAILLILKEEYTFVGYIITGLLTFISTKNLSDKQSEILEKRITSDLQ